MARRRHRPHRRGRPGRRQLTHRELSRLPLRPQRPRPHPEGHPVGAEFGARPSSPSHVVALNAAEEYLHRSTRHRRRRRQLRRTSCALPRRPGQPGHPRHPLPRHRRPDVGLPRRPCRRHRHRNVWQQHGAALPRPLLFIRTDVQLDPQHLGPAYAALGRAPLPFETSVTAVFAAGDVRRGSMRRDESRLRSAKEPAPSDRSTPPSACDCHERRNADIAAFAPRFRVAAGLTIREGCSPTTHAVGLLTTPLDGTERGTSRRRTSQPEVVAGRRGPRDASRPDTRGVTRR